MRILTSLVRVSISCAWSSVTFMNCKRVRAGVSHRPHSAALVGTSSKPRMKPSIRTCIKNGLVHKMECSSGERSEMDGSK